MIGVIFCVVLCCVVCSVCVFYSGGLPFCIVDHCLSFLGLVASVHMKELLVPIMGTSSTPPSKGTVLTLYDSTAACAGGEVTYVVRPDLRWPDVLEEQGAIPFQLSKVRGGMLPRCRTCRTEIARGQLRVVAHGRYLPTATGTAATDGMPMRYSLCVRRSCVEGVSLAVGKQHVIPQFTGVVYATQECSDLLDVNVTKEFQFVYL